MGHLRLAHQVATGPATLAEPARATGADRDGLSRLLRAAITVGLLAEPVSDQFVPTRLGQTLPADAPDSVSDYAPAVPLSGHGLPYDPQAACHPLSRLRCQRRLFRGWLLALRSFPCL